MRVECAAHTCGHEFIVRKTASGCKGQEAGGKEYGKPDYMVKRHNYLPPLI